MNAPQPAVAFDPPPAHVRTQAETDNADRIANWCDLLAYVICEDLDGDGYDPRHESPEIDRVIVKPGWLAIHVYNRPYMNWVWYDIPAQDGWDEGYIETLRRKISSALPSGVRFQKELEEMIEVSPDAV